MSLTAAQKSIVFIGALALGYFTLSGRLIALGYRALYPEQQLLSQQLRGDGCWYHYDKDSDGSCDFEWSYFDRAVRNPEYRCPMRAAKCLAIGFSSSAAILPELKRLKSRLPAVFDTGDGVIEYLGCFEGAIRAIEFPSDQESGKGRISLAVQLGQC